MQSFGQSIDEGHELEHCESLQSPGQCISESVQLSRLSEEGSRRDHGTLVADILASSKGMACSKHLAQSRSLKRRHVDFLAGYVQAERVYEAKRHVRLCDWDIGISVGVVSYASIVSVA